MMMIVIIINDNATSGTKYIEKRQNICSFDVKTILFHALLFLTPHKINQKDTQYLFSYSLGNFDETTYSTFSDFSHYFTLNGSNV